MRLKQKGGIIKIKSTVVLIRELLNHSRRNLQDEIKLWEQDPALPQVGWTHPGGDMRDHHEIRYVYS